MGCKFRGICIYGSSETLTLTKRWLVVNDVQLFFIAQRNRNT